MFRRIRIDFEPKTIEFNNYSIVNPISTSITDFKNAEVSTLLENGWKLHSVIPIQGIYSNTNILSNITTGVELIFTLDKSMGLVSSKNSKIKKNTNTTTRSANENFKMPDEELSINQKVEFYQYWDGLWNWDGNIEDMNLESDGLAIRTFLINRGLLSNRLGDDNYFVPTRVNRKEYLERKLQIAINCIIQGGDCAIQLFDAFNAIQVWGGGWGRKFYIDNVYNEMNVEEIRNDWRENYHDKYLKIVTEIINGNIELISLMNIFSNFNGMNIGFGSKHFYFWSEIAKRQFNQEKLYPIYDSFIHKIICINGYPNPRWDDYLDYLDLIERKKIELESEFSEVQIERALFAYSKFAGPGNNYELPENHRTEYNLIVNNFLNQRLNNNV